jgi:glutamate dehydrogenase
MPIASDSMLPAGSSIAASEVGPLPGGETGSSEMSAMAIEALVSEELRPLVGRFLLGVDQGELRQRPPVEMAEALRAHRNLAEVRVAKTANVAVRVPGADWSGSRAAVQVVTDDMPFLVDSVVLAIRRAGFEVELLMHPVFAVSRDADGRLSSIGAAEPSGAEMGESFLHLELDAVPTEQQARELHTLVVAALSDVRVAVEDWSLLRARALELAGEVRQLTAHAGPFTVDPAEVAELLTWMEDGHFILLGAIDHTVRTKDSESSGPEGTEGAKPVELVEVPGSALGILRAHTDGTPIDHIIAPSAAWNPLDVALITKTNSTSTIHRLGHYDIVVIKTYDRSAANAAGAPQASATQLIPLSRLSVSAD